MSRLDIKVEQSPDKPQYNIYLEGAATFVNLPKLASTLEQLPPNTEVQVHLDKLIYIDHTCLDLFSLWADQQKEKGSTLIVQWDRLKSRFHEPVVGLR